MPRAVSQLASRAAVGDRVVDRAPSARSPREPRRRRHCRAEAERFVIQAAVDFDFTALATRAAHFLCRPRKCFADLAHDSLAEGAIVATGFGAESDQIAHNVGGRAAFDRANVARAELAAFFDQPVPALLNQIGVASAAIAIALTPCSG